jgi:CheY-like chemotaxis protein
MLNVLLIEDNPVPAKTISGLLTRLGHSVKHVVGMRRASASQFWEKLELKDHPWEEVDLSQFHVAIVDGMLIGKLHGWDAVPALVRAGLTCIAISSEETLNKRMQEQGAQCACVKDRCAFVLPSLLSSVQQSLEKAG